MLIKRKRGQALVEYALTVASIGICVAVAVGILFDVNIPGIFNTFNDTVGEIDVEEIAEQVNDVYMATEDDNVIGFYIDPHYEKKYPNLKYYLVSNGNWVELIKDGGNEFCPIDHYCLPNALTKYNDLVSRNAKVVIKSDGKIIQEIPLSSFVNGL